MDNLVDMEMDDERQNDLSAPFPMLRKFKYPPGLRICLCDGELEKLGLDADCEEGDYIHIVAFATVISVHKENGQKRVELQIEKMALEDESKEAPDGEEGESEEY